MAPPTRRRKRALAAAPLPPVIHPADRLSRLPEEIQAQILSFLPAQEAVRTCVLARAWRDVWKSTRRLRITGGTVPVRKFVHRLLRLRLDGLKRASLDEFEIEFPLVDDHDTVSQWIHTSLKCQVQTLRVLNKVAYFDISDRPFISRHLTRLELGGIAFGRTHLNLDGCPALEHLEIRNCLLLGLRKIVSPSLESLVITKCSSGRCPRIKISAPRLVSLWLEVRVFMAPLVESMPELVEAHVRIDPFCYDCLFCDGPMYCGHGVADIISDGDVDSDSEEDTEDYPERNTEGCALLEGLAQAKRLVLFAHHSRSVFISDLRMCPTFSNLKTLVLNDYWCEPADCRALACILEHAPVLENLTVMFDKKVELKYDNVLEGRPDATAKSTMTAHCLKTVKVKCHTVHEGVVNVLKFLSTLNICKGFSLEWQKAPHENEATIT